MCDFSNHSDYLTEVEVYVVLINNNTRCNFLLQVLVLLVDIMRYIFLDYDSDWPDFLLVHLVNTFITNILSTLFLYM